MHILFDIGGTKTRIAFTKDGKQFSEPKVVRTPERFEDGIELFTSIIADISKVEEIESATGGIAGSLDKNHSAMIRSSHIAGWAGRPLKKILEDIIRVPVFIENDSAMVGLGEMKYGAGRGFDIGVYITISTGIGGARYVDGKIDKNTFGFEPGHQIIKAEETEVCLSCGSKGCLESLVSGYAVHERFGKHPREIQNQKLWKELAKLFSYGLYNTILHWSPDAVILGGSMITGDPAISVDDIKLYLKENMKIFQEIPEIKKAELGDFGGLYGAMEYLRQKGVL